MPYNRGTYFRGKISNINYLYDKMLDEESRIVFDARIDYLVTRDVDKYVSVYIRHYVSNMSETVLYAMVPEKV